MTLWAAGAAYNISAAPMQVLLLTIWIVAHAILIPCVGGLLRGSRFNKKVPLFFSYLIFEELLFGFLFFITFWGSHHPKSARFYAVLYQWIAVGGLGVSSCLQLGIFYEIVNTLILPRSPILARLRPLLRWAMALTILLATGISAIFSTAQLRPLAHVFDALNFSANLVNCGLLLVLLLYTRTFYISWKSLPAGIALGFGINSSIEIGASSLISALGMKSIVPGDIVRMAGFLVCSLIWLFYIFRADAGAQYKGQGVQKSEIEAWHEDLQKVVER